MTSLSQPTPVFKTQRPPDPENQFGEIENIELGTDTCQLPPELDGYVKFDEIQDGLGNIKFLEDCPSLDR